MCVCVCVFCVMFNASPPTQPPLSPHHPLTINHQSSGLESTLSPTHHQPSIRPGVDRQRDGQRAPGSVRRHRDRALLRVDPLLHQVRSNPTPHPPLPPPRPPNTHTQTPPPPSPPINQLLAIRTPHTNTPTPTTLIITTILSHQAAGHPGDRGAGAVRLPAVLGAGGLPGLCTICLSIYLYIYIYIES